MAVKDGTTGDDNLVGTSEADVISGFEGNDILNAGTRPVGRLYWAGEHTVTHGFASTIHGAYVSGERAAKEVLAAIGH